MLCLIQCLLLTFHPLNKLPYILSMIDAKRLIGRSFSDEAVQNDTQRGEGDFDNNMLRFSG